MPPTTIHAAIDIGTNSILLLIAKKVDGSSPSLTPIIDQAQTVRLGENLLATGFLSNQAMERTINGLTTYAQIINDLAPTRIACFGTEALRQANNADIFCQRIRHELGWDVHILSPNEEAHYTFHGAISSLRQASIRHFLVIDIGGGSTEIIYRTATTSDYQKSFSVGAVALKEAFHLEEQIDDTTLKAIKAHVKQRLAPLPTIANETTVLLTGGTATTLAALDQQLKNYDIQAIDGHCIDRLTIDTMYERLNQLSLAQRADLPGMEPGRADIILPALAILLTLLTSLNINTVQISVRGARYGILL